MDVGVYPYPHGDPLLIDKIVNEFLSQGKFDKLRKECMSDADTKPAYQNLVQRVENTVTQFLKKQVWKPDLNKNQLRDSLRKHILESKFFDAGINRIVDQVVNQNVLATVFLPEVEEVVYNYLSIPRPSDKNQKKGLSDERIKPGKDYDYKTSQEHEKCDYRRDNHGGDEEYKGGRFVDKKPDILNEPIKTEPRDEKDRVKSEPEEEIRTPVEKMEISSDESQESINRIAVEGLNLNEAEGPSVPDSDDSAPLEINEKSVSESRDSEDSIMNQMSPISQGRLTPDLVEELIEEKPVEKPEEKQQQQLQQQQQQQQPQQEPVEEKKPLSFIGRIPKIKREDSVKLKEKLDVKNIYSSDESDSSKSYGKSDSDEKRRRNQSSERKRDDSDKSRDKKREDKKRESSRDRHKDHKRERSRERHKKSSSSSSSSQRERSSSHHKSSHRHKDSKSKRKEEEKKKSKSTDDHGKERNKKEDRRSTDRDSNERERGRSSGSRTEGEGRKREKEQQKTEEGREETNQKEEAEVEKEGKPQEEAFEKLETSSVVDFNELFRSGAVTRLEFPKLTDDFYVKFNSTGFRYFEEWEKSKLDCEEEFKEFVDEAENNLALLSDDESEFELENSFADENRKTISNLLKGLGNFRKGLMFDPVTSEFYRWRSNKFYQKYRKKEEKPEKLDESIKENINRGEKNRALHLKLLNKYKRKAMRMGKPRRRQRRPEWGGIKEKNENRTEYYANKKPEKFLDANLVETTQNSDVPESVNSLNGLYENGRVTMVESSEESLEWTSAQKNGNGDGNSETKLTQNLPLNLPPSPDSDDVISSNGTNVKVPRKRIMKETEDVVTAKKQTKRNLSQKYDSQDLYKPRPMLNGSRTRGRERGTLERDLVSLGSSDAR